MYSESDVEAAVAAGALTPEAARRFRDHVAAGRHLPAVDEEHFRLLTGFNDIFVAIAAAILLFAVGWIGHAVPPHLGGDGPTPFMGLFIAATAWGLAEFFTKRRRMALPSILLLLAFLAGTFITAGTVLALAIGEAAFEANEMLIPLVASLSAAAAVAAAWLHWRRFRVPITVAGGAAAVVALVMSLALYTVGDVPALEEVMMVVALALGIGVFLFAMWWDSSDPKRETRRSDVAFWLHLLSAPLIVHPVFSLLGLTDGEASVGEAVIVLLVYVALGLAALAIDRRALLVSGLAYVLWALIDLFERFGAVELNVALAAFAIGSGLLLLSAFWHNARSFIVHRLPAGLRTRLPDSHRTVAA